MTQRFASGVREVCASFCKPRARDLRRPHHIGAIVPNDWPMKLDEVGGFPNTSSYQFGMKSNENGYISHTMRHCNDLRQSANFRLELNWMCARAYADCKNDNDEDSDST